MSWVFWGIILVLAGWVIWTYNGLVALRNPVAKCLETNRRAVKTPLRSDSQPGGNRQGLHEARAGHAAEGHRGAQQGDGIDGSQGVRRSGKRADPNPSGKSFCSWKTIQTSKANQNVLHLQEELTTTENQIAFSRQYYNDLVMRFNTQQEVFPGEHDRVFFPVPAK